MDDTREPVRHSALVVDEIREDPVGRDERHLEREYVTFRNDGETPLDVSGWSVENDAGRTYRFPEETVVRPGGRLSLHSGRGDDDETDVYWGAERPIWRNAGDTVVVRDADGTVRLRESYE